MLQYCHDVGAAASVCDCQNLAVRALRGRLGLFYERLQDWYHPTASSRKLWGFVDSRWGRDNQAAHMQVDDGLFRGGGIQLLGVQLLMAAAVVAWSFLTTLLGWHGWFRQSSTSQSGCHATGRPSITWLALASAVTCATPGRA